MISVDNNSINHIEIEAFYNKNFKAERLIAYAVVQTINAICLTIIGIISKIFSDDLSTYFFSLSDTQLDHALSALDSYDRFGDNLIDSSHNQRIIRSISDISTSAVDIQNNLKSIHGETIFSRWSKIGLEDVPLEMNNLKRSDDGHCLGMSLDFLKEYLNEKLNSSTSSMNAILKISSRYFYGAPKEAEIAQIFYMALNSESLKHKYSSVSEQFSEEKYQQLQDQIELLTNQNLKKDQFIEAFRDLHDFGLSYLEIHYKCVHLPLFSIISNQFNLQLNDSYTIGTCWAYLKEDSTTKLANYIDTINDGAYLGTISRSTDSLNRNSVHSIALIKSQDKYFLFNPNDGILIFDKNELLNELLNITKPKNLINPEKHWFLALCECQLNK